MAPRFFGRYEHSLDAKGRVILPARYRGSFDTIAYLAQHQEGCLALWTPDEFEKQLAEMEATQDRGTSERNMVRIWSSGLSEVELDRQGRVAIPAYLREYAHLENAVLVVGALNRIELWNPEQWDRRVKPAVAQFIDPDSRPATPTTSTPPPGPAASPSPPAPGSEE